MKKEIIEITEEIKIPGTDIVLEKGDRIEVLKESDNYKAICHICKKTWTGTKAEVEIAARNHSNDFHKGTQNWHSEKSNIKEYVYQSGIRDRFIVWQTSTQRIGGSEEKIIGTSTFLESALEMGIQEAQRLLDDGWTTDLKDYKQGAAIWSVMVEDQEMEGPMYYYWIMRDTEVGSRLKGKINGFLVDFTGRVTDLRS